MKGFLSHRRNPVHSKKTKRAGHAAEKRDTPPDRLPEKAPEGYPREASAMLTAASSMTMMESILPPVTGRTVLMKKAAVFTKPS